MALGWVSVHNPYGQLLWRSLWSSSNYFTEETFGKIICPKKIQKPVAAFNRNSFWVSDSQLAGILLDTQNLNSSAKLSKTRDAEAVQLLLVGSAPSYRNALFDQCMQFLSMNAKNKIKEFSCKQRALYLFSFLPFLVLSSDARSTWQCLSWSSAPQICEVS